MTAPTTGASPQRLGGKLTSTRLGAGRGALALATAVAAHPGYGVTTALVYRERAA